jgi:hypothetical protein
VAHCCYGTHQHEMVGLEPRVPAAGTACTHPDRLRQVP